ncbi:bestrophin-4-like isoform X1 [Trichogramma pretiosum]|uniref:bestrophin-4-like isoform X1 n=1 Tax=Trichogramma pretiosum TaxID=7493 RepID=UPI0006C971C9|nr:bestrophin-4-like isoform X1 [Trichogramma pretiosum]
MTVSYQYEVASSTSGGFTRLLFKWRGSLYKLIYREVALFVIIFDLISAIYRQVMTPGQRRNFEHVVVYCDTFINLIPLSFVLGFYVAYVAGRWWQQYNALPWPDKSMHVIALYVEGTDDYARMTRRSLMRYLNLSLILVLRSISSAVKRRFPTLDHVVSAGFMTHTELQLFQSVPNSEFNTYWIPCTWYIHLLKEARAHNRIPDSQGLKMIVEEFNDFRAKCGLLWSFDWVSIPLVYTQVVTLATYSFFAVALIGRQYIDSQVVMKPFQIKIDVYFPCFTILQFFFFMGLLKVAEQLINPFGDDDEDFELNWLIDRHIKVSYLGVDTLMDRCPSLVKDMFFNEPNIQLPYTEAAAGYKRQTYRGSVANMTVPEEKQTMFLPNIIEEEESLSSATPRTSSANLAAQNDSPTTEGRQGGGDSPEVHRESLGSIGETSLSLDMEMLEAAAAVVAAAAAQDQQAAAAPGPRLANGAGGGGGGGGRTNGGGGGSLLSEAVRIFKRSVTPKPQQHQQGRPFYAAAQSTAETLQPWPSATNLQQQQSSSDQQQASPQPNFQRPITLRYCGEANKLQHARSFNVPRISVRQASIDRSCSSILGGDRAGNGNVCIDIEALESANAARQSPKVNFNKPRSHSVCHGTLFQRQHSIPEESASSIDFSMSNPSASSCNLFVEPIGESSAASISSTSTAAGRRTNLMRRPHVSRFLDYPKYLLSKNHRKSRKTVPALPPLATISKSVEADFDDDDDDDHRCGGITNLAMSKSSPEMRIDLVTSSSGAGASGSRKRSSSRATFYPGIPSDSDSDDDHHHDNDRDKTHKRS